MPKPKKKKTAAGRSDPLDPEERARLKSIQVARPGVVRGKDIWDLSTLKHAHRRRRAR